MAAWSMLCPLARVLHRQRATDTAAWNPSENRSKFPPGSGVFDCGLGGLSGLCGAPDLGLFSLQPGTCRGIGS